MVDFYLFAGGGGKCKMLWVGITVVDTQRGRLHFHIDRQEMHGPYADTDELSDALAEIIADIDEEGCQAFPVVFELCGDDVPEVLTYNEHTGAVG